MERVGDRLEKIEGHCSIGQSPQWAVVPMEEEEEEEEKKKKKKKKKKKNNNNNIVLVKETLMEWRICSDIDFVLNSSCVKSFPATFHET